MKKNYITRIWSVRLPTKKVLASYSHERFYTSGANMMEKGVG